MSQEVIVIEDDEPIPSVVNKPVMKSVKRRSTADMSKKRSVKRSKKVEPNELKQERKVSSTVSTPILPSINRFNTVESASMPSSPSGNSILSTMDNDYNMNGILNIAQELAKNRNNVGSSSSASSHSPTLPSVNNITSAPQPVYTSSLSTPMSRPEIYQQKQQYQQQQQQQQDQQQYQQALLSDQRHGQHSEHSDVKQVRISSLLSSSKSPAAPVVLPEPITVVENQKIPSQDDSKSIIEGANQQDDKKGSSNTLLKKSMEILNPSRPIPTELVNSNNVSTQSTNQSTSQNTLPTSLATANKPTEKKRSALPSTANPKTMLKKSKSTTATSTTKKPSTSKAKADANPSTKTTTTTKATKAKKSKSFSEQTLVIDKDQKEKGTTTTAAATVKKKKSTTTTASKSKSSTSTNNTAAKKTQSSQSKDKKTGSNTQSSIPKNETVTLSVAKTKSSGGSTTTKSKASNASTSKAKAPTTSIFPMEKKKVNSKQLIPSPPINPPSLVKTNTILDDTDNILTPKEKPKEDEAPVILDIPLYNTTTNDYLDENGTVVVNVFKLVNTQRERAKQLNSLNGLTPEETKIKKREMFMNSSDLPNEIINIDDDIGEEAVDEDEKNTEPKKKAHPMKGKSQIGKYDMEDPFIDDSEMAWDEQRAATKDGFFVFFGPLVEKGQVPKVERTTSSLKKNKR